MATAEGIRHVSEVHRLGLFTALQYRRALLAAGLDARDESGLSGRGVYVGIAPKA
jgi:hypothetical protein